MFSYGTELPSYIGLMENPYFASLQRHKVLQVQGSWDSHLPGQPGLPAVPFAGNVGWGESCPRLQLSLLTDPWVLEVRKDKKSFFLVNANYVFKRDVLILKGGRAALSALQFLNLSNSGLEAVASCCSIIHTYSMEQILQKELGGLGSASPAGEKLLWQVWFSCFSSLFSSVTFWNKRMLLLNQMCLELAKKCPASLADGKKKKRKSCFLLIHFFPQQFRTITKLELQAG